MLRAKPDDKERAILAGEVRADARVRVIEDLDAGARGVALAQRGEELPRLGRVCGDGFAWISLGILAVQPVLNVREATDDVAPPDLEHGATAFFGMRRARVREHVVQRCARQRPSSYSLTAIRNRG